ncbi:MAG: DNA starvation/stationary phase protection protein [Elusimicrobia bacterium RIFCSPLOWO2_01_FULL_60_11]|nr:MAG: DNA starvation/stationary phase protection protein [Elusimicrobia bacterium RIFCSPLOWO2_01_FULL_60_11]
MSIHTGLESKDRQAVAKILHKILADEYILLVKTKNFHWNVVGPDFTELHKLFDEQYAQIAVFADDVAERARSLGEYAIGTMEEFLKFANLRESPGKYPQAAAMIEALLNDHETVIRELRKDLQACADKHQDMGTSDFLTGLMEEHEKIAWMLRAYQQK